MKNLLKADWKRVTKDKLLLVMGVLAVAFAVILPLLYVVLFSGRGVEDETLSSLVSGKGQFFGSFSLGNNLGLIAPVLLAIVLCKDFSFGTIRNKIIAGQSRSAIYMSLLVTCASVLILTMLLHAFVTLGVSLLFFDYQPTAFALADLWYFLISLGFELLVLFWVAALLAYLCANMKNVGLVVVLYIAITLSLVIVGGGVQVALAVMETVGGQERWMNLLRFLDRINVGNAALYIGTGTAYTGKDVLYFTVSPLLGILGFTGLGLWSFRKKDLK